MTKAIGLYLVWTGIIWSVIFMVGIELDANERIRTGLGYMLISALIEIGSYRDWLLFVERRLLI